MVTFTQLAEDFAFDIKSGALNDQGLMDKYNLTSLQLANALEFYTAENSLELEKLLVSHKPVAVEAPAEEIVVAAEPKPEFGYKAVPRNDYIFVKPLPKTHKGRLVIPDSAQSESDMGFVQSVGSKVVDVKPGDLVLFDRFSRTGSTFPLIDVDGEQVELIQMLEFNITAILTKVRIIEGVE